MSDRRASEPAPRVRFASDTDGMLHLVAEPGQPGVDRWKVVLHHRAGGSETLVATSEFSPSGGSPMERAPPQKPPRMKVRSAWVTP